ncbi:MAG: hypothetical protein KDA22_08410 [Phycisphaerales bacterium]|nr:hypothetical protein [Phycisphaerales bacterium]
MLSFRVFEGSEPATNWPLSNAHLLERDDLAVRSEITFADGVIRCRRRGTNAAALCLLHDAGPLGRLMLQTCLLPDRDEPYVLSLELARYKIKQFIAKSEEWQMFELPFDHPATERWEQARSQFTLAMNETDPVKANGHARASLDAAIEATERLALAHAEILLHRRFGGRAASSTTLGFRVWPGQFTENIRTAVTRDADVVMLPVRWNLIEIAEGRFDWDPLDRWMSWAQGQGKPVVAGPLLDFSEESLPEWMKVWQHDYDTCRDLVYDHLERVVSRYRGVVGLWNLASGLNTLEHFVFSPEQMVDLVRMAALLVRQMRKGARTMVELVQPFGEFTARRRDALPPLLFLDRLLQEGVQLDCVGVQLCFGNGPGHATRDLMQISSLLDRFLLFELPVMVTALGVPALPGAPQVGCWHGEWSPQVQSDWAARIFPIAMSKPFVEAVFWAELYDHPLQSTPGLGLLDAAGVPRPAMPRLCGMRRRLRRPLGANKGVGALAALGEDGR